MGLREEIHAALCGAVQEEGWWSRLSKKLSLVVSGTAQGLRSNPVDVTRLRHMSFVHGLDISVVQPRYSELQSWEVVQAMLRHCAERSGGPWWLTLFARQRSAPLLPRCVPHKCMQERLRQLADAEQYVTVDLVEQWV
jgi:hypothetical protein